VCELRVGPFGLKQGSQTPGGVELEWADATCRGARIERRDARRRAFSVSTQDHRQGWKDDRFRRDM